MCTTHNSVYNTPYTVYNTPYTVYNTPFTVQGRDEDSLQVADAPRVHDAGPADTLSSVHNTLSSVHNTLFSVYTT